ncbi:MAG: AAA family ATPase [Bacteroidia bacterium]|nr:AAA family ATPase [Bacteroidia bacterium]
MDLNSFLRVLQRRKWLILAITSVAVITTFVISSRTARVYRASGQLATGIVDTHDPFFASGTGSQPQQRFAVEAQFKNVEEQLRSVQVLQLVSFQLMLHDLEKTDPFRDLTPVRQAYTAEELRVARERYRLKLEGLEPLHSADELERKHLRMLRIMNYDPESLLAYLYIKRIPGTDFIGIEFSSENPYLSAFVVNTLCQEFIRYYANSKAERSRTSIEFYSSLVAEKKQDLDEKIRAWEAQQAAGGRPDAVNPVREVLDPLAQLEQQRASASQEMAEAERQLTAIHAQLPANEQVSFISRESERGRTLALLLLSRMNRLNQRWVRSGFQALSARDSLENTRIELRSELVRSLSEQQPDLDPARRQLMEQKIAADVTMEVLRERIRAIDQELRRLSSQAGTFTASDGSVLPENRELEIARDAYLIVLNKLNEAKFSALEPVTSSMTQVAFVQPPDRPEPSKTMLLTALSGLVSISLCVVGLFLLEYLDTSIRFPSRLRTLTGLELLGPLNRLHTVNLDLGALFSENHANPSLESYKQLLRKIRYEVSEAGPRTLLITSTREGAGKTSLMVSLGYSLSLSGKRVLLIDTNFKHNALTRLTSATPSLESYLNREIPFKQLISKSIFDNLDVIGCEGSSFSPAEMLKTDEFEQLLIELAGVYDFILFEGAALNAYPDTKELTRFAARVLPVFSATHSITAGDLTGVAYLKSLGSKLMPAVLNKVESQNLNL